MISVLAPAKVNFGLEILGKRDDGYHEIRTVLCALSVFDSVDVDESDPAEFQVDVPTLRFDNLVDTAMDLVGRSEPRISRLGVRLRKRIPVAAGLGGASSDAAAALLAIQRFFPEALDNCAVARLASKLGSDVPFFLRSGLAVASGRGEVLRQLPHQRIDIVIATPQLSIAGKTATMYELTGPADWTDGANIDRFAASLRRHESLSTNAVPRNAFSRALYAFAPELSDFATRTRASSGLAVHISGAGPAHYVVCQDQDHRTWVRDRLRDAFRAKPVRVLAGRSVPAVLIRAT